MKKKTLRKKHRTRKKKPITENILFSGFIFSFIVFCMATYFIAFNPFFQIETVVVEDNANINSEALENFVKSHSENKVFFLKTQSTFLISTSEIRKSLLEEVPTIGDVDVKRNFPDSLKVKVVERKPVAFWCREKNKEKCFFVDRKGVAFEKTERLATARPVIVKKENPDKDNRVLSAEELSRFFLIHKSLEKFDTPVNFFEIVAKNHIAAHTKEGIEIYFTFTNTERELENIKIVLEEKLKKENRVGLDYIDMRFGDRVYYK